MYIKYLPCPDVVIVIGDDKGNRTRCSANSTSQNSGLSSTESLSQSLLISTSL